MAVAGVPRYVDDFVAVVVAGGGFGRARRDRLVDARRCRRRNSGSRAGRRIGVIVGHPALRAETRGCGHVPPDRSAHTPEAVGSPSRQVSKRKGDCSSFWGGATPCLHRPTPSSDSSPSRDGQKRVSFAHVVVFFPSEAHFFFSSRKSPRGDKPAKKAPGSCGRAGLPGPSIMCDRRTRQGPRERSGRMNSRD